MIQSTSHYFTRLLAPASGVGRSSLATACEPICIMYPQCAVLTSPLANLDEPAHRHALRPASIMTTYGAPTLAYKHE